VSVIMNKKKNLEEFKIEMNGLGSKKEPFLFVIDYDCEIFFISSLEKCPSDILISMPDNRIEKAPDFNEDLNIIEKISFDYYKKAFDSVQKQMLLGNTYLLNLTFPTEIKLNTSLKKIFYGSNASFKFYFKDQFVCFSPERFVKLEGNSIKTYPMKGTIDASIPNAKEKILNDEKEQSEHLMVVDLLRNDLSMVSEGVRVNRYRYIDVISAGKKELLQVSSEIEGFIGNNWHERIGDIILPMLPAGSITGAPKLKTMEIIKDVEGYNRGFYTGIFGLYNGHSLDSSVIIRYIEKNEESFQYKSGGGITFDSDAESEYNELLAKVYIPVE
jgi:para-aminobenzoate synthetase component 1